MNCICYGLGASNSVNKLFWKPYTFHSTPQLSCILINYYTYPNLTFILTMKLFDNFYNLIEKVVSKGINSSFFLLSQSPSTFPFAHLLHYWDSQESLAEDTRRRPSASSSRNCLQIPAMTDGCNTRVKMAKGVN